MYEKKFLKKFSIGAYDAVLSMNGYELSWYDPYNYINFEYAQDIELMWRYDGMYFNVVSKLYKYVNPDVSLPTFRKIVNEENRVDECKKMGIQPVFVKRIDSIGYYISSDGVLLSIKSISPLNYSLRHGYFTIMVNGEYLNGNRAVLCYNAFINAIDNDQDISWRNDIKGDCSVSNLTKRVNV